MELCRQYRLLNGLVWVYNRGADDFVGPVDQFLRIFHSVFVVGKANVCSPSIDVFLCLEE